MRDAALFRQIQSMPIPLARPRHNIAEIVAKECDLDAAQSALVVAEYRRFLYLLAVSKTPLAAPPVINFVWKRQFRDAKAGTEEGHRLILRLAGQKSGRWIFTRDPQYQETLDLYQAEFGGALMTKIWPTVAQRQAVSISGFGLVVGLWVAHRGYDLASYPLMVLGLGGAVGAIVWTRALNFWAERSDG